MAQFGRALRSGRRGRPFESGRFDFGEVSSKNVVNSTFFGLSFFRAIPVYLIFVFTLYISERHMLIYFGIIFLFCYL